MPFGAKEMLTVSCQSVSFPSFHTFVALLNRVGLFLFAARVMGSWQFSPWKPCWQPCAEGRSWTSCAVSLSARTHTCSYASRTHRGAVVTQRLWISHSAWNLRCFLFPYFPDIFSQISDSSGVMMFAKFDQFLREVLKLPTAVFEGPSFGYTEHSVRTCFPQQVGGAALPLYLSASGRRFLNTCASWFQKKIVLNTFLDVLMADPPPQCLVWLPLMHRLANVENGERGRHCVCCASRLSLWCLMHPPELVAPVKEGPHF